MVWGFWWGSARIAVHGFAVEDGGFAGKNNEGETRKDGRDGTNEAGKEEDGWRWAERLGGVCVVVRKKIVCVMNGKWVVKCGTQRCGSDMLQNAVQHRQ